MDLKKKVRDGGGVYKRFSNALEKLGIVTFEDFLYHVPFRYEDYSLISKISDLQEGEMVTVQGKILDIKNISTRGYRKIQRALIEDGTDRIEVIWFNQPYLVKTIYKDDLISVSGKVAKGKSGLMFVSPEFEVIGEDKKTINTGRIVPVYPETRGISSKWLRKQVHKVLSDVNFEDYLPSEIISKNNLLDYPSALSQIHFPSSLELADKARQRLSFDELLTIQARAIIRKKEWSRKTIGKKLEMFEEKIENFIDSLPFKLTNAQVKALSEIIKDLTSDQPMNRLLEGDVGSGKTVVSAIASYLTYLNGLQTAFIAPTEILVNQHFNTLSTLLSPLGMKIELVTSKNKLKTENFDLLLGTHAMLSEKVNFKDLGLVVIDEQQRFGVEQRGILRKKGDNPHLLTMTATPIPRTVALTLYGDLSLSILDELPAQRKRVKTWLVSQIKRDGAYDWITKQIKDNKSQAFIICPFIEESESMVTVKAAKKEFEHLHNDVFRDLKLGLLHGKQKTNERDEILSGFKNGKIDILVATPIVEVGIDIPNATIIVIEAAERFGLAQLHQLRGRVGRGEKQSYCLIFTDSTNPQTAMRLKSLETIYIGAKLAEIDLRMRGGGELYGTRQHGQSMLKIADLSNFDLIQRTRKEAEKLVKAIEEFPRFAEKIKQETAKEVSPD